MQKDYDKNKESSYLKYFLHGWVIVAQKSSVDGFK